MEEEAVQISDLMRNGNDILLNSMLNSDMHLHLVMKQGAEGRLFEVELFGKPAILKERFKKKYRHPALDEKLTIKRLQTEGKFLQRVKSIGIDCPTVYFVDMVNNLLCLEKIEGETVRHLLEEQFSISTTWTQRSFEIVRAVGTLLARLHDNNIIHGDLTTSNLMIRSSSPENIVIIDFGLGFNSKLGEDKAVDLYVLERAFISSHTDSELLIEALLQSYKDSSANGVDVMKRLDVVRQRGRKKLAFG